MTRKRKTEMRKRRKRAKLKELSNRESANARDLDSKKGGALVGPGDIGFIDLNSNNIKKSH